MKEKIIGIYCIENTVNGKKYIGQSKDIKDRWRRHISELRKCKHDNSYLQENWIAYGESAFKFYVLEECSPELLDEKEKYYIDYLDSMSYGNGFNLTTGGKRGNFMTDEIKQKMSKSVAESYTDELREIRRQDALDYWSNPENRKRMVGENNGMYGKHHSEESKRKMSEAKKGKPSWRKNKRSVLCKELQKKFDNASQAGKQLSLDSSGILKVCYGQRHTCGGYHWSFC